MSLSVLRLGMNPCSVASLAIPFFFSSSLGYFPMAWTIIIKRFCCYSCVKQSDWLKTFERPIRILGTNLHYNILTNLGLHIFTMFCQYLRSWAKTFYNIDPWPMTAWQIPRRVAMKILPACEGTRSTSRRWPSGGSGYLEEMQVAFTQSELREKIQSVQYLKIMFQLRFALFG